MCSLPSSGFRPLRSISRSGSGSHAAQTARILERYEAHLVSSVARRDSRVRRRQQHGRVRAGGREARRPGRACRGRSSQLRPNDARGNQSAPDGRDRQSPPGLGTERRRQPASAKGVGDDKIRLVGNVMIDTLRAWLPSARACEADGAELGLSVRAEYGFVTLHRPSNVDDPATLRAPALAALARRGTATGIRGPSAHARRRPTCRLGAAARSGSARLVCLGPQPYLDTLSLSPTRLSC